MHLTVSWCSHHMCTLLLGNKLFLAPLAPDIQVRTQPILTGNRKAGLTAQQNVLDIGTGTGLSIAFTHPVSCYGVNSWAKQAFGPCKFMFQCPYALEQAWLTRKQRFC